MAYVCQFPKRAKDFHYVYDDKHIHERAREEGRIFLSVRVSYFAQFPAVISFFPLSKHNFFADVRQNDFYDDILLNLPPESQTILQNQNIILILLTFTKIFA